MTRFYVNGEKYPHSKGNFNTEVRKSGKRGKTMQLKNILKKLCEDKGMSVTALSKKTGIPAQTIFNWLSGAEPKSLVQVKAVAEFFGVSLDYICFGDKTSQKFEDYMDDINAGQFEVILRRLKRKA